MGARAGIAALFLAMAAGAWLWFEPYAAPPLAVSGPADAAIAVSHLPRQGQKTYRLIHQGGPFPYDKDGMVFGNRERLLPSQQRGYYREYTVQDPAAADRGAHRIVCGGTQPERPDACYYTSDHYSTFKRIIEQ